MWILFRIGQFEHCLTHRIEDRMGPDGSVAGPTTARTPALAARSDIDAGFPGPRSWFTAEFEPTRLELDDPRQGRARQVILKSYDGYATCVTVEDFFADGAVVQLKTPSRAA